MTPSPVFLFEVRRCPARVLALVLAAAPLLLASCTLESRPLARVGPSTITVGEFLEAARASGNAYPQNPDSAKLVLLDELVRRELLRLEARQRGLIPPEESMRAAREAEDAALMREMTSRFAPTNLPVSQAELERYYEWSKTESHVRLIHAQSDALLLHARERIEAGEDFTSVALRMNTTGVVQPDGDFGYVPGGAMPEPLDGLLRNAPLNQVIGPVRVGSDAWFLAQVSDRRQRDVPPLAEIAPQLEQQIRVRKQRLLLQRAVEQMQRSHDFRLEPDAAQAVFSRVQGTRSDTTGLPDELVLLARYRTEEGWQRYMLSEAIVDLARLDRPNLSSTAAIARWLETTVLQKIVLVEGRSRRLNEEPAVRRAAEDRADGLALQALYQEEILAHVEPPTESDLRAEYAARAGPQAPPFESLPPDLLEQLHGMVLEERQNARMQEYTETLRRKHPVMIDAARLERLAWPFPDLGALQGLGG